MKKRLLAMGLAAGCTAFFAACGDETTNTDILNADAATSADSLPKCDKSYEGMLASVSSKGEILVCTQGEWERVAKTIQTSADSSGAAPSAGCTAKTTDGGVNIVCDGKTVATLKNGSKGEQGDTGAQGAKGKPGTDAADGSNGSSGADLTLGEDGCSVHRMIGDVVIYNCGDNTYLESLGGYKADFATWNALSDDSRLKLKDGNVFSSLSTIYLESSNPAKSSGKLERWEEDGWSGPVVSVTSNELRKNFAVKGTATLTVEAGATKNSGVSVEPLVGIGAEFSSTRNITPWGGFCITYSAEKDMEFMLVNASKMYVARAKLPASAGVTTENILSSAFESEEDVLNSILKGASAFIVKAVGSLEEGEYKNTFAVYEIGPYGACSGYTVEDVKDKVNSVMTSTGTLVDDRTDPAIEYKTVTIGDQTWMAENLRIPLDFTSKGGKPMHICPEDEDEYAATGCLYSWAAAVDSAAQLSKKESTDPGYNVCGSGVTCAATAPIQGICPDGWHLPSLAEVRKLMETAALDDYKMASSVYSLTAEDYPNWLGFSANIAGFSNDFATINKSYYDFNMWTSDESDDDHGSYMNFNLAIGAGTWAEKSASKGNGETVRCIKDAD